MDALETADKLMKRGCYMTSVDPKDACYSISIAPEHHKYLKSIWKHQLYAFNCLQFFVFQIIVFNLQTKLNPGIIRGLVSSETQART